jgi:hypothetical protein
MLLLKKVLEIRAEIGIVWPNPVQVLPSAVQAIHVGNGNSCEAMANGGSANGWLSILPKLRSVNKFIRIIAAKADGLHS